MRALLVVNPEATATSLRVRDVIARALASQLELDVAQTRRRGHAVSLAAQAAADGIELVVALGGDGTVNEVVNGLAGTPVALAVVPGGSANVFARALGYSPVPVEATGEILDALRAGRRRTISLGLAGDRYFAMGAGVGLDAEIVRLVERQRKSGRRATPALYVRDSLVHLYRGAERRHPALTLSVPGEEPVPRLFTVLVANGSPWTYLGDRPVDACPQADFAAGLDLLAMRRLGTGTVLRTVGQMLDRKRRISVRAALQRHDLAEFTVVADRPLAAQLDGEFTGEVERLTFRSVPRALTVVA